MATDTPVTWYKDATFYEVSIRSFMDSNGDGCGDFPGLTSQLDYIEWLGATCIWLLPMLDSPLQDGGYDVRDYYTILSKYGTMEDFKAFLDAAHARNIRVIADLVLNHTSDQHPWFVESRSSRTNPKRDWYVWNDTNTKYSGCRIIFTDTETSNWTYDDHTGEYYWHRFFSHQPDLNYDNEDVKAAMKEVVSFYLEMGLDGFRLDAVPYLFEREGTNGENLPQTHEFIAELRTFVDGKYPGRILLAEANQTPQDVVDYFGKSGNECHLAYHFPIMPRLYIALRLEDAAWIVNTLKDTPAIPESCQWAMFLRNHDELTLEFCNDEERTILYREYAPDPRMKCNIGIRRRLAPLVNNNRSEIELLHGLLFGMPGSPFLYYGDEIGMGDNIALPDRDGVRTPMQWTSGKNGGFSSCVPERLAYPVITEDPYGFQTVNVESQKHQSDSLLLWLRHMISVRSKHPVFGRGTMDVLPVNNTPVLAFLRTYGDETILCVYNLGATPQTVHLGMTQYLGFTPIDIVRHCNPFPVITKDPYEMNMDKHEFVWLYLERAERAHT